MNLKKNTSLDYFHPLQVNLTGEIRWHYDEQKPLPAHELVIRPLLENAIDAFIYKGAKEPFFLYGKMQHPIQLNQESILISDRGKFKFDKTKECITGHEYLWNATSWKRGSIVIIIKPDAVDFGNIFRNTHAPSLTETPNMGNTIAATKKCKIEMENGNVAICLSASNGLEWMCIYAKGEARTHIINCAQKNCRDIQPGAPLF